MSRRIDSMDTPLAGLVVLQRKPLADQRGFLERVFCQDELAGLLNGRGISQINRTRTIGAGTVRGMHFQYPPHAEAKFVSCLKGAVFDVAVDIRRDSKTYLHWYGEVLSAENHRTLAIPVGFAHGFQTLEEDCELLYLHTAAYAPDAEGGLNALDPAIGIDWQLPTVGMSARDQSHDLIDEGFEGVLL